MRTSLFLCCLIFSACSSDTTESPVTAPAPAAAPRNLDYVLHEEPGISRYGLIEGSPLVVVLGGTLQGTLTGSVTVPAAPALAIAQAGFGVLSMDLPDHDATDDTELVGWARDVAAGKRELFTSFCTRLSAVLDHLAVSHAAIVGISRGGYVAAICAARDPRFNAIALLAPVTDLARLYEFDNVSVDETIYGLDRYQSVLVNHPILVRIGKADDRVGTDAATSFAEKVGATLQVLDVVGHSAPEDGSTVKWIRANF